MVSINTVSTCFTSCNINQSHHFSLSTQINAHEPLTSSSIEAHLQLLAVLGLHLGFVVIPPWGARLFHGNCTWTKFTINWRLSTLLVSPGPLQLAVVFAKNIQNISLASLTETESDTGASYTEKRIMARAFHIIHPSTLENSFGLVTLDKKRKPKYRAYVLRLWCKHRLAS